MIDAQAGTANVGSWRESQSHGSREIARSTPLLFDEPDSLSFPPRSLEAFRPELPSGAIIEGNYRYVLWRTWDVTLPIGLILGLNPSTANAFKNDNTMRKCIKFAKAFGWGCLLFGNLFAWRDKNPRMMRLAPDPVGVDNDFWLGVLAERATMKIAAWGTNGSFVGRDRIVMEMFDELYCLAETKDGHPQHPLYLKDETRPKLYAVGGQALSRGVV